MNRTLSLSVVAAALFAVSGCSSTTVIKSRPSGAVVRNLAGEKICKTPCTWSGSGPINATDILTVQKPGYEETTVTVRKDQVNGMAIAGLGVGALLTGWTLIGAVGFVVPMFWMADYKPVYELELDRARAPQEEEGHREAGEEEERRASRR